MGLLDLGENLDPKKRTFKVNEEVEKILKKYNRAIDVMHTINIIPLKDSVDGLTKKEQEQEDYKKA